MSGAPSIRVSHIDFGVTSTRVLATAGVWAVTRSLLGDGWVVTHVPSGCAMRYYGLRHKRRLALKIMRELHRVAPDWRRDLTLLGTDMAAAQQIAQAEESDLIRATLKRLHDAHLRRP